MSCVRQTNNWVRQTNNPRPNLALKDIHQSSVPPMPPVKQPKKEKIQRIYEDDDFIIDLFPEDKTVRVSIFKDNHFQDEVFVRKAEYCMVGGKA